MQELVRKYIAGTYVFREGEAGNDAFILRTGKVRLFRLKGPREIQLDEFLEGRLFGEAALVERAPRGANAIATTNSECYAIDRREYNARIAKLDPSRLRALRNLHIFVHRMPLHDAEGRRVVGTVPEDVEKTVRAMLESDLAASLTQTGDAMIDLVAEQVLQEARRRLPASRDDEEIARVRERLKPKPAATKGAPPPA